MHTRRFAKCRQPRLRLPCSAILSITAAPPSEKRNSVPTRPGLSCVHFGDNQVGLVRSSWISFASQYPFVNRKSSISALSTTMHFPRRGLIASSGASVHPHDSSSARNAARIALSCVTPSQANRSSAPQCSLTGMCVGFRFRVGILIGVVRAMTKSAIVQHRSLCQDILGQLYFSTANFQRDTDGERRWM